MDSFKAGVTHSAVKKDYDGSCYVMQVCNASVFDAAADGGRRKIDNEGMVKALIEAVEVRLEDK